jgi:hypothetical protein
MIRSLDAIAPNPGKYQKRKNDPSAAVGFQAVHPPILRLILNSTSNPAGFFLLPEHENRGYTLFSYPDFLV